MSDVKSTNVYDDGNIPDVDLPQNSIKNKVQDTENLKNNEKSLSEFLGTGKDNVRRD